MKPHLLARTDILASYRPLTDAVHTSCMAGVEDKELAKGFNLLRHFYDLVRADHAAVVHHAVIVAGQHIILVLEKHPMSSNEEDEPVCGLMIRESSLILFMILPLPAFSSVRSS